MSAKAKEVYAGGAGARYLFMGAALFLTAFGLVMIYSASSITAARDGSSWHFFVRQLIFIGLGVTVAAALARFDYRRLQHLAMPVWGTGIALLVVVLLLGVVRGGARRWIPLGLFNLQPSELAKIACVLMIAAIAIGWQRGKLPTRDLLIRTAWVTGIPALLIMAQPDMGTTMTLIVAVAIVLVLAGINLGWMGGVTAFVSILGLLFIQGSEYRMARVTGFMNPWADPLGKGYQTVQALLAFGTGGVDGVGLGLSRQKFFYLPEAHTDFILAIIGEETGLIGTLAIVAAFCVFVYAGFRIAMGAKDPFGRLVAGGLTGMLAFQGILNMAAVTGMMPVTGKPLPFVSYGGSSMLVTMICVGLILSVASHGAKAPRAVRTRPKPVEVAPRESAHERRRDRGPHLPRARGGRPARRRA